MSAIWGGRYIDDIILRYEYDPGSDYEAQRWYCTDEQFSVAAILDGAAALVERIEYDPYGKPRHHFFADIDNDGDVWTDDLNTISNLAAGIGTPIANASYIPDADINRDGVINGTDETIAMNEGRHSALALGVLSHEDNIIGFSGYLYNPETQHYHVRFRVYDTALGRWLQRDPLGYVDGMNLYGYGKESPLIYTDPTGTDVWIEGDSGDEPGLHLSICVGDPNGQYVCFRYGWNGNFHLLKGLRGVVYRDVKKGGEIDKERYIVTTPGEDALFIKYLEGKLGDVGPYRVANQNCRTWSKHKFDVIKRFLQKSRKGPLDTTPPPLKDGRSTSSGGAGCTTSSSSSSSHSTCKSTSPYS